jgi:hypothetical protein
VRHLARRGIILRRSDWPDVPTTVLLEDIDAEHADAVYGHHWRTNVKDKNMDKDKVKDDEEAKGKKKGKGKGKGNRKGKDKEEDKKKDKGKDGEQGKE